MTFKSTALIRDEFQTPSERVFDLFLDMHRKSVKITRTQAKTICRMCAQSDAHTSPKKAGRIIPIPNGNDVLILDYAKRAPRFKPSCVTGRVHSDTLRTVLRPGLRLELLISSWFDPVLRLLRIIKAGGTSHAG
jgi:hypothetical protein